MFVFSGHFTRGVVDAGFQVISDLEDGSFGVSSHRDNFPSTPVHSKPAEWPIVDLAEEGLDLLYGNPACAGFSLCFVAGTQVLTTHGPRAIESLRAGNIVMTYNATRFQRVTQVFKRSYTGPLTRVSADGVGVLFTCTPEHPICTGYAGEPTEWTPAKDCDDRMGWFPTDSIMRPLSVTHADPGTTVDVYNIEVESDNCYLASGMLVHNCNSARGVENSSNDGLKRAIDTGLLLRPRAFVIESVSNLFREGDALVSEWEKRWHDAGYNTTRLLENAMHLGLPQTRRRALFVAARANLDFVYANHDHVTKPLTVRDAIGDLEMQPVSEDAREVVPYSSEPLNAYQAWCRRGMSGLTWHVRHDATAATAALIPHIPAGHHVRDVPESIYEETYYKLRKPTGNVRPDMKGKPSFLYRRLHWDRPSTTLTGGAFLCHPEFDRLLTVREKSRLMGIPDSFVYAGKSKSNAYNEVGKAVSPLVGQWVAENIARCLADPDGRVHKPVVDLVSQASDIKKKNKPPSAAAKRNADDLHAFVSA